MGSRRKSRPSTSDGARAEAAQPQAVTQVSEQGTTSTTDASPRLLLGQYAFSLAHYSLPLGAISLLLLAGIVSLGHALRLHRVDDFFRLLHGSEPWFNYRAAEYMSTHGWTAFFRWFDYMSWYPLGRPVGSTTYPGLQFTAVAIHRSLAALGMPLTLNEVCVLMPVWGATISTLLLVAVSYEITPSKSVALMAAALFTATPAHLMRSMAGEFDNECIAVPALLLTFYLWMRSLRTPSSWPIGALAGVAYGYMVAAWGGYTFVLNMVALHAGVAALVDWGRNTYSNSLLRSYALFYVVGTSLSTLVPPVGMAPFKSLELLGALVVLLFLGSLQLCEVQRKRADVERTSRKGIVFFLRSLLGVGGLVFAAASLAPADFIRPLSPILRMMFMSLQRSGDPLIDMLLAADVSGLIVAGRLLLFPFFGWMIGFSVALHPLIMQYNHAKSFLYVYGLLGIYVSTRSMRAVVAVAPAACLFTALVLRALFDFTADGLYWPTEPPAVEGETIPQDRETAAEALRKKNEEWTTTQVRRFSLRMLPVMVVVLLIRISGYFEDVAEMVDQFAAPGIVFPNSASSGMEGDVIDDYYQGFRWLHDNTPEDARVLAWWDYGYQITGIGNRTSLADGNTWNHEHIATIGKMLTSPVAEAHSLVRHMADYVLIFAGNNSFSDVSRSPLLALTANSVYRDICPDDPLCTNFGFRRKVKAARQQQRRSRRYVTPVMESEELSGPTEEEYEYEPTPLLSRSLLYHLHASGSVEGITLDVDTFERVYISHNGLVRIFKVMNVSLESKRWIADAANRVCNPPGSWICPGQYPPAKEIQDMLAQQQRSYGELVSAYEEAEKVAAERGDWGAGHSDL